MLLQNTDQLFDELGLSCVFVRVRAFITGKDKLGWGLTWWMTVLLPLVTWLRCLLTGFPTVTYSFAFCIRIKFVCSRVSQPWALLTCWARQFFVVGRQHVHIKGLAESLAYTHLAGGAGTIPDWVVTTKSCVFRFHQMLFGTLRCPWLRKNHRCTG